MPQWRNSKDQIINILFTSVGRRVELIEFWKTALGKNRISGMIFGTDIDPLAPAFHKLDKGFLVSRSDTPQFPFQIIEICESHEIDLLFPLIDPDIPVLAQNKIHIEKTGTRVIVVNPEFADISQDKWKTYDFFKSIGINTPKSWLPSENKPLNSISYPLFIKPRSGSASVGAVKVTSQKHLETLIKNTDSQIIQEYIEGDEITCDVICGLEGGVLSIVQRQRIEVRSGEVSKGKTVFHQNILDSCKKIAESMNAIGPITIQCIIKDEIPYFIEINPRYGGGAPLGIAAGVNSPEWYIKKYLGLTCEIPKLGEYTTNLYMTRYDQTFFLVEDDLLRIKSDHI